MLSQYYDQQGHSEWEVKMMDIDNILANLKETSPGGLTDAIYISYISYCCYQRGIKDIGMPSHLIMSLKKWLLIIQKIFCFVLCN